MKTSEFALPAIIMIAIILAGCTANPQDTAFTARKATATPTAVIAATPIATAIASVTPGVASAAPTPLASATPEKATATPTIVATSSPTVAATAIPSPAASTTVTLTLAEVAKHNTPDDCWMAINGDVLDLSGFYNHPGGSTYVPYCGTDATAAYNDKGGRGRPHSNYATSMFSQYLVGTLGSPIQITPIPA